MRKSFRTLHPLSQHNPITKLYNHSFKNLNTSNRLKSIIQSSQKILPSRSTRNTIKLSEKKPYSPKYFKKDQNPVKYRLNSHENKQNVKLPHIQKSKIKIYQQKKDKKLLIKDKLLSGNKLVTEPSQRHFLTINEEAQRSNNIKQSLLQILDSSSRKSISIQAEIEKLSELTKKSTNLRKHLRTIQQDMLSLNLKKKISKITQKNQLSLLE